MPGPTDAHFPCRGVWGVAGSTDRGTGGSGSGATVIRVCVSKALTSRGAVSLSSWSPVACSARDPAISRVSWVIIGSVMPAVGCCPHPLALACLPPPTHTRTRPAPSPSLLPFVSVLSALHHVCGSVSSILPVHLSVSLLILSLFFPLASSLSC